MRGSEPTTLRIGLAQMRCGEDREANLEAALRACRSAAEQGAALVCLPELFLSPYPCQTEDPSRFDLAGLKWKSAKSYEKKSLAALAARGK